MSSQVEPLADEDDAFGRLLLDHLAGRAGDAFLDRDDGWSGPALGPEWFFAEPNAWADPERVVFEHVRGRVLDIGAGAGDTASRRSAAGSRSLRSTSRRVRSRPAAVAGSRMPVSFRWRRSMTISESSTRCSCSAGTSAWWAPPSRR